MTEMTRLEKAYLDIKEPSTSGGGGSGARQQRSPGSTIRHVRFQFNPKELTLSKSANWETPQQEGASSAPYPQFKGAAPASMSIEIFLDASESQSNDIMGDVEELLKTVQPTSNSRGTESPHPPLVIFGWGSRVTLTAIVKQVSAKYTMFKPNGTPTRATCTLSLEEYPETSARQNPTSGGIGTHTSRTVRAGDSLPSIANDEYGHPRFWRGLAALNGIEDPFRMPVGTTLLVPPDDEVEPLS